MAANTVTLITDLDAMREFVSKQNWEINNAHAVLSGALLLLDELPQSDDLQWKIVRLVQLAEATLSKVGMAISEAT
jgi:hypothetical protein